MKTNLRHHETDAFTILEVMIALSIFFMCVFAILGVVSRGLNQARHLQPIQIDATTAIAELSLTNRLEEGPISPEIVGIFESMHPGFTVQGNIVEVETNGLFEVSFIVGGASADNKIITAEQKVLLFRPLSPPSSSFGGGLRR
jgi:hypothetical protein